MKTTLENVLRFIQTGAQYTAGKEKETKLTYAIKRVMERAKKINQKFHRDLEDERIRHAAVDGDDVILTDGQGNYRFKREQLLAFRKKELELQEREVDIEPFITECDQSKLSEAQIEAFDGFVLDKAESDATS
jgi:hypothetical protein